MMNDGYIKKIRRHPHILGLIANKTLLTELHSQWILYIWDTIERRSLQGHRGSYKTTAITIIGCIWWLLFHPDDRIAIVRKTFTDAADCLKTISKIMKMPEIQLIFEYCHGVYPKGVIDRADKLAYNFKSTITPEGNIDAYGIDTISTGSHYDRIILDDFVTPKDRSSKAEREKTKNVVREIQTNIIDPGKPVSYIGTPWHKGDCWERQQNGKRIVPEPVKYDVYSTGLLTKELIEEKRNSTTGSLFAANYELKHITNEEALFKEAHYDRWSYKSKSGIYGHLDAKFKGSHTNGLTFMRRKENGRIQAIGFCFEEHIQDKIKKVKELYDRYYCGTIYIEENADKGYVAKELQKMGMLVSSYHESLNKHVKIEKYLYKEWGNIDWDNDTDPDYINQILDYIEGQEPDDCPDSAASLIRARFYTEIGSGLYE